MAEQRSAWAGLDRGITMFQHLLWLELERVTGCVRTVDYTPKFHKSAFVTSG